MKISSISVFSTNLLIDKLKNCLFFNWDQGQNNGPHMRVYFTVNFIIKFCFWCTFHAHFNQLFTETQRPLAYFVNVSLVTVMVSSMFNIINESIHHLQIPNSYNFTSITKRYGFWLNEYVHMHLCRVSYKFTQPSALLGWEKWFVHINTYLNTMRIKMSDKVKTSSF